MQIEKAYFTLGEILARWRIPEADLIYLAENGQLRLSVRVFELSLEFGHYAESVEGGAFREPERIKAVSGLLDLEARDLFHLFREGEVAVTEFRSSWPDYVRVVEPSEAMRVRMANLLVRREERDRFEAETGFSAGDNPPAMPAFFASENYREVRQNGVVFHLGPIQAQVVQTLYDAARNGDPWRSGKALLTEAGSRSLKMSDLFKSKPNWRQLIVSNGRGFYRLAGD